MFPNLWAGVVRSSRLSSRETIVDELGDVKVPNLCDSPDEEYVCTLHIPMDDVVGMQSFKSFKQLMGSLPDKLLVEPTVAKPFRPFVDLTFKVSTVGVLHHNAQGLDLLNIERALVGDDVGHADGGQEADLIQCS